MSATVTNIQTRLNQELGPNHRVRPNSIRWHAGTGRYIFTREPVAGGAGVDRPLPIRTGDWWSLDNAMMENLIDRSARWSLLNEIGSVAAAQQIPNHPFQAAARNAMQQQGALDYMRNKIRSYLPPAPNHAWRPVGRWVWGSRVGCSSSTTTTVTSTYRFMRTPPGARAACAWSRMRFRAPNVPPPDQIRLGKIALKYLDPFDQGLRGGGITREIPGQRQRPRFRPATSPGAGTSISRSSSWTR